MFLVKKILITMQTLLKKMNVYKFKFKKLKSFKKFKSRNYLFVDKIINLLLSKKIV